jgi:hypothetical protein
MITLGWGASAWLWELAPQPILSQPVSVRHSSGILRVFYHFLGGFADCQVVQDNDMVTAIKLSVDIVRSIAADQKDNTQHVKRECWYRPTVINVEAHLMATTGQ